jgi:hypothetical protein
LKAVTANSDEPDLRIGFGVVLALAEPSTGATTPGILAQAGFQLDLVGTHQVVGPAKRDEKRRALTYAQWRLGLNADQQLQVDKNVPANNGSLEGAQIEQALAQADQIALSGQIDQEWPSADGRFSRALSASYALSWERLQTPALPTVVVGGTRVPVEGTFSVDAIQRTRNDLAGCSPSASLAACTSGCTADGSSRSSTSAVA